MHRKNGQPIYNPLREPVERDTGRVKCSRGPGCEGCPYPGHGFICWSADGSCLRSNYKRKEGTPDESESGI